MFISGGLSTVVEFVHVHFHSEVLELAYSILDLCVTIIKLKEINVVRIRNTG